MFLYTNRSQEWIKIPARSIEDIEIPEAAYKPDFELAKQHQDFSKELVRFSLLGIAGYGFLIKEVLGKDHLHKMESGPVFVLVMISLTCLASSAGLGLYCADLNKACLRMQIAVLRLLQRMGSDRWTNPALSSAEDVENWKRCNSEDIARLRQLQKQNLTRSFFVLRVTIWLLIVGILATVGAFVHCV